MRRLPPTECISLGCGHIFPSSEDNCKYVRGSSAHTVSGSASLVVYASRNSPGNITVDGCE